MKRPKREDFKHKSIKCFADVANCVKQYSKKQDEYIDYLESQLIRLNKKTDNVYLSSVMPCGDCSKKMQCVEV